MFEFIKIQVNINQEDDRESKWLGQILFVNLKNIEFENDKKEVNIYIICSTI